MKFQIISITLLIYCVKCKQNLQLVWSEEFNGKELDANVWEVEDEWQSGNCYGNFIGQLNCNVNQSKNLRLIDGCLAITAVREKQKVFDKEYTSAKIKTKMNWTYGRFEIRAALPVGKMLRPVMAMVSVAPKQWATAGHIDIMSNIQTQALVSGVHFSASPPVYYGQSYGLIPETRVNQFHTYAVEWSERQMSWFFDGMRYFTFHLNHTLSPHYVRKGEPFVGKPFKILITLGVGGLFFPNQLLTVNDSDDWKCSAIIVDYVKVYQMVNNNHSISETFNTGEDRTSSAADICPTVMSDISRDNPCDLDMFAVIIIISSLLIFV